MSPRPQRRLQRLARLTGLLFLITFATSIPPYVYFYADALGDPNFILKGGFDRSLAITAGLERMLILANIGTAPTIGSIHDAGTGSHSAAALI